MRRQFKSKDSPLFLGGTSSIWLGAITLAVSYVGQPQSADLMDLPFGKFHGSLTADVWPGYGCFPQILWMRIQIVTWMPTNILDILSHSDLHSLENHSFIRRSSRIGSFTMANCWSFPETNLCRSWACHDHTKRNQQAATRKCARQWTSTPGNGMPWNAPPPA